MPDLVSCRICGVHRRRLGAHLKATHGMTTPSYLELFPDASVDAPGTRARSDECRVRQSEAAKRRWSDPGARREQSDLLKAVAPWKGKQLSAEHRAAISAGGRGVPHDLLPEYREELRKRGREALAKVRSRPDHKIRLSEGVRRRLAKGEQVGFQVPGRWEKGYQTRIRNGTLAPQGSGRGICGFRKDLTHYTRSTLEANFARILVASGIRYEYEPRVFDLGPLGHYTPDFFLHDPVVLGNRVLIEAGWVELKGWRGRDGVLPGKAQEKIDALRSLVAHPTVALAEGDPVWQTLSAYWKGLLPMWETPRVNLRTDPARFTF